MLEVYEIRVVIDAKDVMGTIQRRGDAAPKVFVENISTYRPTARDYGDARDQAIGELMRRITDAID